MNEIEKDFFDNANEKTITVNTKTPPKWCPTEREYREQCGPVKTTSALPDLPTFRDRLSWLMARECQNKKDAAKRCDIPYTNFISISTGKEKPSKKRIKAISNAYMVPENWLSNGECKPDKKPKDNEEMIIPVMDILQPQPPRFQLCANGKYPGAIIKQLVLGLIDDDTYQINMTVEG